MGQKEKEAIAAMKVSVTEQREKESLALKETLALEDGDEKEAKKEQKAQEKNAQKAMLAELNEIEKMRAEREKERQQKWREAAGLAKGNGGGRGLKRLLDMSSMQEGTPTKAA